MTGPDITEAVDADLIRNLVTLAILDGENLGRWASTREPAETIMMRDASINGRTRAILTALAFAQAPALPGREVVAIVQGEHDHWIKEALKHKRPGGRRSDCAERDLDRAKVAKRILEKLIAAAPTRLGPGHVCEHGIRWPHACDDCDTNALAKADAILSASGGENGSAQDLDHTAGVKLDEEWPPNPSVALVYDLLCDTTEPPGERHWEGWMAERIVAALSSAKQVDGESPRDDHNTNVDAEADGLEDELVDTFRGDNALLVASIAALLHFERAGALIPHGLGGTGSHAYQLLSAAASRLAAMPSLGEVGGAD